KYAGDF
ncbi:hypothetical protein CP8484711_0048B, partial [Chlamydia psittaci 84-8471/1]